jgi:S-formylglutathione hydrolase
MMMTDAAIARFELAHEVHGPIPCVVLQPDLRSTRLPVCLFLYGGGGHPENLTQLAPILLQRWREERLAPMLIACAGVPPFCFYLDDAERGMHWESVVSDRLLSAVRSRFNVSDANGLVGISMGGYGALKIAFAQSATFRAVAAVAPMLEPALCADGAPLRNRFHYPHDVPAALLGAQRDAALYAADHPAQRAIQQASAIRTRELGIYLDAGGGDALNAHDGAEFLHRVLWDLDIRHDYHLLRAADHVGPSVLPRLLRAFAWVAEQLTQPLTQPSTEEQALRDMLAAARERAAQQDETVTRSYGRLPSTGC